MYGLNEGSLAAVRGFGELTPSDGMDAWVAALLHLRAAAVGAIGDDAHEAFAQADLLASYVCDPAGGRPDDETATARLEALGQQVAQIGWHDAVMKSATADFEARVNGHAG